MMAPRSRLSGARSSIDKRGRGRISGVLAVALFVGWINGAGTVRADDSGDPGALQFKKSCGTCHTTDPKAPVRQGPNLHGVVGRAAGSLKGFKYSPAFVKAAPNITWTADMIDKWITDPQQVIPGTVMLYHQSDPDKRQLIISYLQKH
jgi:cytochrome c